MVCLKLITGSFRVGVSKLLVTRALAALADMDSKRVAQRLVGYTDLSNRPNAARLSEIHRAQNLPTNTPNAVASPTRFFLAHALRNRSKQFEGPARRRQSLASGMEVGRHSRASDQA